jgi:hypothetical protein
MERGLAAVRWHRADRAPAADRGARRGGALIRAALLALLAATVLPAVAEDLRPFTAEYSWTLRGLNAGQSTLTLARRDDGRWSYDSRSAARGLFRLIAPGDITQISIFHIENGEVLPEHYRGDDGTASTKRDANLSFDWHTKRVTGVYEDVAVDLPLDAGVQDDLSIQIAMMNALLHAHVPAGFRLIDRNLVKEYQYTAEGRTTLATPLGPLEAVIYRSRKIGAHSSTLFWSAPALGFLPLKVERHDGADKVEWSLAIRAVKRD